MASMKLDCSAEPIDLFEGSMAPLGARERLEKFFFVGDDRNVKKVFVDGRQVK